LLQRLGHGQDLEQWKADVLAGVQAGRRRGIQVRLFDLAGFDKAHIQEVPIDRFGSGSSSFNYFDSVHYRGDLAQSLLNALVSARVDPSIGVAIDDEQALTERQLQVRQHMKVWRSEHSESSARIAELICKAGHC